MWNIRSRFLPLLVVITLVWIFFYYSFDLVSRLREARTNANDTIAWFWAGTQVPMSRLAELGMLYVCSECGSSEPAFGFGSDSTVSRFCQECGKTTVWYFVSMEDIEERGRLLRRTRILFRELVDRLDYSTILSDVNMVPQVLNGAAVSDTVSAESLRVLGRQIEELDSENNPIPIMDSDEEVIGYLHYGSDDLAKEIIMMPYIELGILFVLVLLFLYVIRVEMKKEKELSWIGFAKETAHQISTPLSSLMGWIELLKDKPELEKDDDFTEALECIENDIDRLKQIANRYGQMGKAPKLEKCLVNSVILDTVHYICGRPGFLADGMNLETDLSSEFPVDLNRVLFSWVIENLLKNSIAAFGKVSPGLVCITTRDVQEGSGLIEVEIADNGKGIPFVDQKKVFRAGFSTRRGGWGLGLSLSKRIIEKYHKGKLRLKASSPGKGTTFIIQLPASSKDPE
jgi:signal transduction histidine kinase